MKPAPVPDVDVLWQAAVLLLLLYLILFSVVGLLVIARTRLSTVQAATYADTVRLDETSIRTGEGTSRREVAWPVVQELVRANVYPAGDLSRNNSQAAVAAQDARVIIQGRTAWYESLLQRIDPYAPPQARRADVSFSALRSPMGALYLITLAALILLSILSLTKPELLFANLAGTPYSLADLYPYFYLGLFLPPMGWFVIQPLRQRRRIDPQDIRPALIVGGVGLALAALRVVTRFRPWLTVPDIYPTLTIIILVGSAAITLLRAPRSAGDRVPVWARGLGAAAAVLVLTLMTAHLWREVVSYDYLVRGNKLRDEAVLASPPDADTLGRAKNAYDRALQVADTPLLGIKGRAALQGGPGLPSADKFIWAAATNSRAVMRLLLGEDPATIKGDFDALLRATQHPAVYVERALAALWACTRPPAETPNASPTPDRTECLSGVVDDLSRAIDQEQENDAKYLLWRGFAHHSLGSIEAAEQDYKDALNPEKGALEEADRATALTGLGWIDLGRSIQKEGSERRQLAEQASEMAPDRPSKWTRTRPMRG